MIDVWPVLLNDETIERLRIERDAILAAQQMSQVAVVVEPIVTLTKKQQWEAHEE